MASSQEAERQKAMETERQRSQEQVAAERQAKEAEEKRKQDREQKVEEAKKAQARAVEETNTTVGDQVSKQGIYIDQAFGRVVPTDVGVTDPAVKAAPLDLEFAKAQANQMWHPGRVEAEPSFVDESRRESPGQSQK